MLMNSNMCFCTFCGHYFGLICQWSVTEHYGVSVHCTRDTEHPLAGSTSNAICAVKTFVYWLAWCVVIVLCDTSPCRSNFGLLLLWFPGIK